MLGKESAESSAESVLDFGCCPTFLLSFFVSKIAVVVAARSRVARTQHVACAMRQISQDFAAQLVVVITLACLASMTCRIKHVVLVIQSSKADKNELE